MDDYDHFTRFIHWRKPREVSKEANALIEELERELSAILAVPLGQWNQVADGYANVWGRYTKDEFAKLQPSYPDPISDKQEMRGMGSPAHSVILGLTG